MGKLAGFQIKILRSALTRYPDAKRVVYSTCSIFPEENEDVVRQVLETNTRFKLVPANKFVNDTWQNFGSSDFGDIGKYCLYAKPNEDYTNGFFVAVFERLEEGEENLFFNAKIYNYKKHVQSQERRRSKKQQDAQHFGTGVVDYDEQFGDGVQQHQNHEIDLQHETIENTNHNINANIKRRKKKK
ncbi:hypothetical protein NQ314_008750 [Rhamnusium bicolor]|uniref:SAM-dependent MTase RsmB/NOP-type domain-containing protein n=1 Tax=Rhamnusium bicolor TaxID=1586634 RepID=A0AAV8Y7N3_9CUCU|nr:hypothetical protein NQ314_008750 [Rhamnusium bicolor]